MNIIQVPAHPTNYSKNLGANQRRKIVLHWMVGEIGAADARFTKPNEKASAHYGIGSNGEVHQYVQDQNIAWHAGPGVNFEGIGIEHAGGQLIGNDRKKPTQLCHDTSAELVAMLSKRYGIPLDRNHVKKHNEYMATQCPGTLDVDYIINKAKDINLGTPTPLNYELYAANGNIYAKFLSGMVNGDYIIIDKVNGLVTDQGKIFMSQGTHDRIVSPNYTKRFYQMTFGTVVREINLTGVTPPVDMMYHVFDEKGTQVGAYEIEDNAFNLWYTNEKYIVKQNNVDITNKFVDMANTLEKRIEDLEKELATAKALNQTFLESIWGKLYLLFRK